MSRAASIHLNHAGFAIGGTANRLGSAGRCSLHRPAPETTSPRCNDWSGTDSGGDSARASGDSIAVFKREGSKRVPAYQLEEPRIKVEVNARAEDIRKELTADAKKTQEELELLQDVIEMEHVLRDLACRNQFEVMIESYQAALPAIKKPIPESVRPMIYRLVIEAAVESGKYSVFNEADLDMIDKALRKDLVFCDSTNLERVALLYLMDGKIDKARSTASACVAALLSQRGTCRSSACQENAAFLYAIFMLIELCEHSDHKQRVETAWSKMKVLQVKYQVQNVQIEALYERQGFRHALNYLALRRSDNISTAIADLRDRLKKREFVVTPVQVQTPSGPIQEDRITEIELNNPTPEPKPRPKPQPKDKGQADDC